MVLRSWWNRSPCSSLITPRFSGNLSRWLYEMEFDTRIASKVMTGWQHDCYEVFIVFSLFITKKVFHYHHKRKLCTSFLVIHLSDKVLFMYKCTNLWCIEHTCLYFLIWQSRESRDCWKHSPSVFTIYALTNCFMRSSLIWRGRNMIVSQLTIRSFTVFGIPAFSLM